MLGVDFVVVFVCCFWIEYGDFDCFEFVFFGMNLCYFDVLVVFCIGVGGFLVFCCFVGFCLFLFVVE